MSKYAKRFKQKNKQIVMISLSLSHIHLVFGVVNTLFYITKKVFNSQHKKYCKISPFFRRILHDNR